MKRFFTYIKPILQNKFFLASLFFLIWMAFFDPKDWGNIAAKKQELKKLQESENRMKLQINETRAELTALTSSAESIERYARENFKMKKDNEDIFIVK